ncbi:MAG TPA: S9 family peptidase [Terriglobales bacterium]|nr:S9 family peptidase [Terriglobales bacterium]
MLRSTCAVTLLLTFALLLTTLAAAQAKHPFTFEDMMALKRIGDPILSPDGHWILFGAADVNLEPNTKTSHLWVVPAAGGESRQITNGPGEDRGRWSPDGKEILFVSARDGVSQIWVQDFDSANGSLTGDLTKITSLSTGADGALWSPDGKTILFISEVYPDCPDDACNKSREEAKAKSKVKARVFTRLLYRHWNAYFSGKRSHLFVVPAAGGAVHDITPGDHDVPPFSLGGPDDYSFSPDGREIAYTSNHDPVEAISTNNDIFIVPVSGGAAKKISTSPGSDSTPLYSPDGKWIAWRMQKRGGYESDRFRLVIYNRKTGVITKLTEGFDRWVGAYAWAPDSQNLYFAAEDQGEAPIFTTDIHGAAVKEVASGEFDSLAISPDGKSLYFDCMSVQRPNEICSLQLAAQPSCDSGRTKERPAPITPAVPKSCYSPVQAVSHVNDPVLSRIAMSSLEPFWFTGAERAKVQGFLIKPPDFDSSKKYPVKFLIHGGPQGAWGDSWSYRWNAELFAANGYVVIMVNPRGSTGYGQRFIDDINGDWGGRAYVDLMTGLDYAERTYPFIDKQRECALGASYGGYMINWILGHTNRFRCLVSHDGMFNSISAYGTTEELWFNEWEFKGTPWTNRPLYEKWSPNNFATKFKTPTLVIHGQLDYRLDASEGFQLFTTMQRLNVPSKMLYFPDEGHWVLKPQNSQLWYKTVNDWVDSYLKK